MLSIVDSFTDPSQEVHLLLPTIERSTVFSKSCRTYATNIWPTGRSFKNRLNVHIFWTPTPTYIAAESGKEQYNKGTFSGARRVETVAGEPVTGSGYQWYGD